MCSGFGVHIFVFLATPSCFESMHYRKLPKQSNDTLEKMKEMKDLKKQNNLLTEDSKEFGWVETPLLCSFNSLTEDNIVGEEGSELSYLGRSRWWWWKTSVIMS